MAYEGQGTAPGQVLTWTGTREEWLPNDAAGLCGTVLEGTVVTAAQLQTALDTEALLADEDHQHAVYVCADEVVLEAQVNRPSFVTIFFNDSHVTTTLAPAVGLADDPLNFMLGAQGVIDAATLNTVTTAIRQIGSRTLPVAGLGTIAPGDYVLIDALNNVTDLNGTTAPPAGGLWWIGRVLTAAAGVITLTDSIKQYFQNGARVRRVIPARRANVVGGFFDARGGSIAVALLQQYTIETVIDSPRVAGFSRSSTDWEPGSRGEVRGLYREGETNCDVFKLCASVRVTRLRCNPDGARFHANGIPRACISERQRCPSPVNEDCEIQACSIGIQRRGGIASQNLNVTVWDTDPSERCIRCAPGSLDGMIPNSYCGSAYDGGAPNNTGGWPEFTYGSNDVGWTTGTVATPTVATTTVVSEYRHDEFNGGITGWTIANLGDGSAQRGVVFADWSGVVVKPTTQGLNGEFTFDAPSPNFLVQIVGLKVSHGGGSGSTPSTAIFTFNNNAQVSFDDVRVGNQVQLCAFGPAFVASNRPTFAHANIDGYPGPIDRMFLMFDGEGTNYANGETVEIDPTATTIPTAISASPGGAVGKRQTVVKGNESTANTYFFAAECAPGIRSNVLADSSEIFISDNLRHSLAGESTADPAAANSSQGMALTYKAAGAPGLVATG